MSRAQAHLVLLLVLLVGGALRSDGLAERSFWYDEAFSYTLIADFSWDEMVRRLTADVHPPFYFGLLRLWSTVWGTSILSMRALSVVMGLLTIVAIYGLCRDLWYRTAAGSADAEYSSRAQGVIAAAFIAVSSPHIHWSRDVKMYTTGSFLAVLSSWLLWRAVHAECRTVLIWLAYGVAAATLMYTHNYGLFTVSAHACFALGYRLKAAGWHVGRAIHDRRTWRALLGLSVAAILYLPWLPVLLTQTGRVRADYWIGAFDAWTVPRNIYLFFFPRNDPFPYFRPLELESLLTTATVLIALILLIRGNRREQWLLLLLVAVPIVWAAGISFASVSIIESRYFFFSLLFFPCIVAHLLWTMLPGITRHFAAAAIVVGLLIAHNVYLEQLRIDERPGILAVVQDVLERRQPHESVIVTHPAVYFSVKYYTRGQLTPRLYVPSGTIPHYLGGPLITTPDLITANELVSLPCERIWVIDSDGFTRERSSHIPIPRPWQRVRNGKEISYRDVFEWQGRVFAMSYRRSLRW